ncbi:MAG: orotidine-5'-phosphate decarboxylase [Thalassobaculales bacterium]
MSDPARRIFVALDTDDRAVAQAMAKLVAPRVGGVKLGLEFFSAEGAAGVRAVAEAGAPVFLDLKFHDIPNTVAGAVRAATRRCRPYMVNVHASGGTAMMKAALEAASASAQAIGAARPLVVAVTVLTSLDDGDLGATGQAGPVADQVLRLARLTQECGLDGVVCAPQEIAMLRAAIGPGFRLVVPGIRPAGAAAGDQKRMMTPAQALAAGADVIVIGRPITADPDPSGALSRIIADLS